MEIVFCNWETYLTYGAAKKFPYLFVLACPAMSPVITLLISPTKTPH